MTLVQLTKSSLGIFNTETYESVDIFEIPIDYKLWSKVSKGIKKCKHCHKELSDFEKTVCIQWHYENKKKTKVSYRCYQCAQEKL